MENGAEDLLRKIEGIMLALFERQVGVILEIRQGNALFGRQWIADAHKDMRFCFEQRMELQLILPQNFLECIAVERIQIEDADFTLETLDVFDDFMGACLTQRELVFIRSTLFDHVHECADSERVMLGRNGTQLFGRFFVEVTLFQQFGLLDHLLGILQKFAAFRCQCDAFGGPDEQFQADFFLQVLDGIREARL